ncbi:MAG: ribokinase [Chloroflexi bacterium]|nr:ribokinase [Chloroflexota bacterium]
MPIEFDYLVVGHVARDLMDDSYAIGGTVSYSSRTAVALGCRVGVITSASLDLDLDGVFEGIRVVRVPSQATTTFENIYLPEERRQIVHSVADVLTPDALPDDWQASIVHIGPIARECSVTLSQAFPDAFLGVTPQGWMRRWDETGHIGYGEWQHAESWLARADAVVLSDEDVRGDYDLIARYAAQTRLLVVTHGVVGCTVYQDGRARHFEAESVHQVDPTGAGDIFAASFFVALQGGSDPWDAARFANCVAACSVTRPGLSGVPMPDEIARCRQGLLCGEG